MVMTQERDYNELVAISNNLKDVIYSDQTHKTIIFDIGKTCHLNSESEVKEVDVFASKTLESLKIVAEELSSLVTQLAHLPTRGEIGAPDVQTARNAIFTEADRGIHKLIYFFTSIQELNTNNLDQLDNKSDIIDQIKKIYEGFYAIKDYLRKN